MHPAAKRADGTIAGSSRLLIGQAPPPDSDQGFLHFMWQFRQGRAQVPMFRVYNLAWPGDQCSRVGSVYIFDLSAPLAAFAVEQVAEDRDQPREYLARRIEQPDLGAGLQ